MKTVISDEKMLKGLIIKDVTFIENYNQNIIHPVLIFNDDLIAVFNEDCLLKKEDLTDDSFYIEDLYRIGFVDKQTRDDLLLFENIFEDSINSFDESDLIKIRDMLNRRFPC